MDSILIGWISTRLSFGDDKAALVFVGVEVFTEIEGVVFEATLAAADLVFERVDIFHRKLVNLTMQRQTQESRHDGCRMNKNQWSQLNDAVHSLFGLVW